ncbi:MAG: tetratricopeptide repeat protein [Saprospiraceae bacterium]|jgi:tetratricopeptide (TPR) repeat protein
MQRRVLFCLLVGISIFFGGCKLESNQKLEEVQTESISNSSALAVLKANSAIENDPQNPNLYYERAQLFYDFGSFEEGIKDMEKAIQLDGNQPVFYHLLADLQLDHYQSSLALTTLETAIKKFPDHILTYLKYAEFLYILKQFDSSISILTDLLDKNPDNGEAFFMLGLNYKDSGDTTLAMENFQWAIQNDPDIIDGWIQLGQLNAELQNSTARQYFESGYRIQPQNTELLHAYAFYLQSVNEIEGAQSLFREIVNLDPQYTVAYFNMGLLYLDQKNYEEAINQFTLALATDPVHIESYFFRGISRELKGDKNTAIADYRQALLIDPDFEAAAEALQGIQ